LHQDEPLTRLRGSWADNYRHAILEQRRAAELARYKMLGVVLGERGGLVGSPSEPAGFPSQSSRWRLLAGRTAPCP
jgi:hypothetical protein